MTVKPNRAFKLARLSACQLGGPASAEDAAAHWLCTSSAVQLSAGGRRLKSMTEAHVE